MLFDFRPLQENLLLSISRPHADFFLHDHFISAWCQLHTFHFPPGNARVELDSRSKSPVSHIAFH